MDILQFLINGKISLIVKLSKRVQKFLNLDCKISFNISCSSFAFPVARKNLQFFLFDIFSITLKKVFAGILFVGPEPPCLREYLYNFYLFEIFALL